MCVCAGLSAMIRGADDGDAFTVRDYGEDELEEVLDEFFRRPADETPFVVLSQ